MRPTAHAIGNRMKSIIFDIVLSILLKTDFVIRSNEVYAN